MKTTAGFHLRSALAALGLLLAPAVHAGKFADFDGDGRSDIFWRNSATGENYLYPMNGAAIAPGEGYLRAVPDQDWRVVGIGDFDGLGGADLLWRNDSTGEHYVYLMQGTAIVGEGYLRTIAELYWQVAGVGDFDGDGRSDILWRNLKNGQNYIYLMDGLAIKPGEGYIRTVGEGNWLVVGVGDFDGNGRADILWRNMQSGQNYAYLMQGTTIVGEGYLPTVPGVDWQVATVAEFDGDGRADILWRNAASGENYLYRMLGTSIIAEGYLRTVAGTAWQIKGAADFNGDGRADVLWRNSASGENYVFLMNGFAIADEGYTRAVPQLEWDMIARTPTARFDAVPTTLDAIMHVVDLTVGTHEIEVPYTCGSDLRINCSAGGVPRNPLPRLLLMRDAVSVAPTADPLVYGVAASGSVVSPAGAANTITVYYNGLDCNVRVNTTAGTSATVQISGTVAFGRQIPGGPIDRVGITALDVSGVQSADLTVTGEFGLCALAASTLVFMQDFLVNLMQGELRYAACGAPGAPAFLQCP
jgi:hypothetical protein